MGKRRPHSALWRSRFYRHNVFFGPLLTHTAGDLRSGDALSRLTFVTALTLSVRRASLDSCCGLLSRSSRRCIVCWPDWLSSLTFPSSAHGIFYYLGKSLSSQALALQMFFYAGSIGHSVSGRTAASRQTII